jgi:pentatricopeptide repeat protein
MRSSVWRPDEITFNAMLHVCAKTGDAERALGLFREMMGAASPTGGKLVPLASTYISLIHACAKRSDFYAQTFNLVSQMKESGFTPDTATYNYLLMACVHQGDVTRAKALWSELESSFSPTHKSVQYMLATYSSFPRLVDTLWRRTVFRKKMDQFNRTVVTAKMGMDNEERVARGLKPVDINEWAADANYNPDEKVDLNATSDPGLDVLREYVLGPGGNEHDRLEQVRQEALEFVARHIGSGSVHTTDETNSADGAESNAVVSVPEDQNGPCRVTPGVLNAAIDVLGAFGMKRQALSVFFLDFDKHGLKPNAMTYNRILVALLASKKDYAVMESRLDAMIVGNPPPPSHDDDPDSEWALHQAWAVYEGFEKYRRLNGWPDRWPELEIKYIRNTWQQAGITHYERKLEYFIYRDLIRGLARYVCRRLHLMA